MASTSNPGDLTIEQKTRLDLERGIQDHEAAVINMKHRLNTLVPVARLPPELLAEVFLYLAEASYSQKAVQNHLPPYRWIRVTHVCQHWREIAVNFPRLWSTISLTRLECITEMLSRSKQAPLVVKTPGSNLSEPAFKLVLPHISRVISFEIKLSHAAHLHNYGFSSPTLKALVLESPFPIPSFLLIQNALHSQFANRDLPGLTSLSIVTYVIPWTCSLLKSTLTQLRLHAMTPSSGTSIEEVLAALESMPLLDQLDLKHTLPPVDTHQPLPAPSRIVAMNRLNRLQLSGRPASCAHFLHHIAFPDTATLAFDLTTENVHEHTLFFDTVTEMFNSPPSDPEHPRGQVRSLAIRPYGGFTSTELKAWTTYHPVDKLMQPDQSPDPCITITLNSCSVVPPLWLYRAIPTPHLESLLLDPPRYSQPADKNQCVRLFDSAPHLRELGVGRWLQEHLHKILESRIPCAPDASKTDATKKGNRTRKQPCMPQLSTLLLHRVVFRNLSAPTATDIFPIRLQKALMARKRSKKELAALVIRDCYNLLHADITSLKELSTSVHWDERIQSEGHHYGSEPSDADLYSYMDPNPYMDHFMDGFYGDDFGDMVDFEEDFMPPFW